MKKGILQRCSRNWEEAAMAPPPEVKTEPIVDYPESDTSVCSAILTESNKQATSNCAKTQETHFNNDQHHQPQKQVETCRKNQRESMIAIRKDYSYKYKNSPSSYVNQSTIKSPTTVQNLTPSTKLRRDSMFLKRNLSPHQQNPVKSPISILERYDYEKTKGQRSSAKIPKLDNNTADKAAVESAISSLSPVAASSVVKKKKTVVPKEKKIEKIEPLKVIVSQEIVKKEPVDMKPPPPPPPENINKINNKINIIFQLNNDRKNIIWSHRRAPKKMVQKITIKEANNNTTTKIQSDEIASLVSSETQTETPFNISMTSSNPLVDEPIEYLFFENEILVSLQTKTISFFEFNRLASLLKRGEPDFKVIDRIPRRTHDIMIDADNKFQRLCYNEQNPYPIYVEMRAKPKLLDDPEMMCPIAFSYCNVYYIDQRRAKFSSVHLDTVKSIIDDIVYTCIPGTSYFIMAWNETSPETKSIVTGIVKYKLTPNLDLAKLASIRQFPKLNYRTQQLYCGKASQLITFGDTQVSIFNYENGDLMMSLDFMKSYGTNLTTVEFKENYLFMVYLADEDVVHNLKRVIVIGVNKCEGNTFKVVQSTPVKLKKSDRIVSKSITMTNHLLITFSNGHVLMIHLNNFCDIHLCGSPIKESIYATAAHFLIARSRNIGLRNFAEFFFTER